VTQVELLNERDVAACGAAYRIAKRDGRGDREAGESGS